MSINDALTTPIPDNKQIPVVMPTGAPCILISGENFQNCTVEIGGKAATNVWVTKDGKSLFAIRLIETKDDKDQLKLELDIKWRNQVTQKNTSVTVINHEDTDKKIPIGQTTSEPEPTRPITTDMGWEENEIKVIHNYLKSPDGQKAIRDYKARGWAPVAPKFRLQVLDTDDNPVEHALIRVIFKGTVTKVMVGLTDSNGEVQIYKYSPEDCMVRMEYGSTGSFEVKDIKGLEESTLDLTEHQEGIKIKCL
jgi:hypothetical protein